MTNRASSAASYVAYEDLVCRSTWRRNCPFSGRFRCPNSSLTGSSSAGFLVMILVASRSPIPQLSVGTLDRNSTPLAERHRRPKRKPRRNEAQVREERPNLAPILLHIRAPEDTLFPE